MLKPSCHRLERSRLSGRPDFVLNRVITQYLVDKTLTARPGAT